MVASDSQAALVALSRLSSGKQKEELARVAKEGRRFGEEGKQVKFV